MDSPVCRMSLYAVASINMTLDVLMCLFYSSLSTMSL